jgi:hypothetical protein
MIKAEDVLKEFNELNKGYGMAFDQDRYLSKFDTEKTKIPLKNQVYLQAINHNYRLSKIDLLAKKRPGEPEHIRDYRNENIRQVTIEPIRKFAIECTNVWVGGGFELKNVPEYVSEWLKSKPFVNDGMKLTLDQWATEVILPYSFVDPNGLLFAVPILDETKKIARVDSYLVPFNKVVYKPDYIAFEAGKRGEDSFYYVADADNWYSLEPYRDGNQLKYSLDLIYVHGLKMLPFTMMPGMIASNIKGEKYKESYLQSAYSHADEALCAYSDDQAVRSKAAHPILIIGDVVCDSPGCTKGQVQTDDGWKECVKCKGTGQLRSPGPLEYWNNSKTIVDDKSPLNPIYLNPDTSVLEFVSKTWAYHFELMKKSLGIDALIDLNESGEAMLHRLEHLKTQIRVCLIGLANTIQDHLYIITKYYYNGAKNEEYPTYNIPLNIEIKNPEIIKEKIKTAIGAERLTNVIDYYNLVYANDPHMKRLMAFIARKYPLSTYSNDEIIKLNSLQLYSDSEVKRSFAVLDVALEATEDKDISAMSDKMLFEMIDPILKAKYPDALIQLDGAN